jgi:hypothetical protein
MLASTRVMRWQTEADSSVRTRHANWWWLFDFSWLHVRQPGQSAHGFEANTPNWGSRLCQIVTSLPEVNLVLVHETNI